MSGRRQTPFKKIGAFLAAAAVAVGLFMSPFMMGSALADELKDLLTEDMILTLHPASETMMNEDSELETTAVADIYRVAYAQKDPRYETIHFVALDAFSDLQTKLSDEKSLTSAVWVELAKDAAGIVLQDEELDPVLEGQAMETALTLPTGSFPIYGEGTDPEDSAAGLYLVLVRNANAAIDQHAQYVSGTDTIVTTSTYKYTYQPLLVVVPSTNNDLKAEVDDDGNPITDEYGNPIIPTVMTSDGEWYNEVAVTLKPLREAARGTFKIVKRVPKFDQNENNKKATFVFEIKTDNYPDYVLEPHYNDVIEISFDKAGEKTWPDDYLKQEDWPTLPVGVKVTVEERYTGSVYVLDVGYSDQRATKTIVANTLDENHELVDNSIIFKFKDDYTDDHRWGGSVRNKYDVMVNDDPEHTYSVQVQQESHDYRKQEPEQTQQ